jgi:hypothetical protein
MARYTRSQLRHDLNAINELVKGRDGKTYLEAQGRNGYTGLDEYCIDTKKCIRNIQCGTPAECLSAANNWAWAHWP